METKTRKRPAKSTSKGANKVSLGVGVGIILLNHSTPVPTILLGKRISQAGHGNEEWSLPGGKPDYLESENRYESTEEAAIRETFEETGLRIKNLCRVYFSDDFFPAVGKQFVTLYYSADVNLKNQDTWSIEDVINKEPNKCLEWKLFPIDMLPSPLFCGVKEALEFWSWSKEISIFEAIVGGGKEAASAYFEPMIRMKDYFNQLRIKKTKDGVSLFKRFETIKQATMKVVPTKVKWPLRKKQQN